jgi:AcrR family transcriptional regulator
VGADHYDLGVPEMPAREVRTRETRARIGETALELFVNQGYAETTFDQIAAAAGVGRRTIFRYFPTKEAIVFDQLVVRREVALERLRDRPPAEAPLVSLHAVLREHLAQGFDRRLLQQIHAVLAAEPKLASEELSVGTRAFEAKVVAILAERGAGTTSLLEIRAVVAMAFGWFLTAVQVYLIERRRSLVKTFDEVVAACLAAGTALE